MEVTFGRSSYNMSNILVLDSLRDWVEKNVQLPKEIEVNEGKSYIVISNSEIPDNTSSSIPTSSSLSGW